MNAAVVQDAAARVDARPLGARPAQVALLGSGTVGSAVLARLAGWNGTALAQRLRLVYAANSRVAIACGPEPGDRLPQQVATLLKGGAALATPLLQPPSERALVRALGAHGTRIVIDATASEEIADCHSRWLEQGIHVVTACKLGQGTSLSRWRSIRNARDAVGAHYGDSATVGAGLPLLLSLRELQAGGDRIHAIAGVLSGSLAWLFNRYDGMRPFSALVRQAGEEGYTEPDPRDDLSGEDVRRKLLILARASGFELEPADVRVDSLVPPALADLPLQQLHAHLSVLDEPLRERFSSAWRNGARLRFLARFECDADGGFIARVGLEELPEDHPLANGTGTDNRVAIWSDRYRRQPLVIQGPGAGAEVTAAGLLDDALRIAG